MYSGQTKKYGGRLGEKPSIPLSKRMYGGGLPMGRLKTGTPPRIKLSSLNLEVMDEQRAIYQLHLCQAFKNNKTFKQLSCYITRTSATTKNN